jgi:predicted amidohydrolase
MVPFAIAGIQMKVSATENNLHAMKRRLNELMALYPWVQMVVFSELAACGTFLAHAEPLPGPTEEAFCAMAAKHRIWLIPGSIYERDGHHIYNTTSVIDPAGQVVRRDWWG